MFEREKKKRVTVNQRVWELLDLGEEDPYEEYEKRLVDKFNYGKEIVRRPGR